MPSVVQLTMRSALSNRSPRRDQSNAWQCGAIAATSSAVFRVRLAIRRGAHPHAPDPRRPHAPRRQREHERGARHTAPAGVAFVQRGDYARRICIVAVDFSVFVPAQRIHGVERRRRRIPGCPQSDTPFACAAQSRSRQRSASSAAAESAPSGSRAFTCSAI